MNLQLNCPFCQMLLSVDARFAGGQMQCPSCQQVFMVGGSAPAIPVAQPIAVSQPAPQRPAAPQAPRPGVPGPPRGGAAPKSYAPVPASSGGGLKIVLGVVGLFVVGGLIYGTMQFLDSAKKKSSAGMELSAEAKAREAERLKAIRQLKEDQIAEKKELENLIKEWIAARIGDTDKRAAEELTRECNSIIQELDKLYADADSNNDPKDLRAFWVERLGKRIEENKIIYHWLGGRPVASLLETLFGSDRPTTKPRGEVADFIASGEYRGSGTGFFVSADGLMVTNQHVVDDATEVDFRGADGIIRKATVLKSDKEGDVAILKAKDSPKSWLEVDPAESSMGAAVFTIGFPNASIQGVEPKFTDGRISSLSGFRDDKDRYQVTVPIQPGNSGGPLVDMKSGRVVGVIVAILSRRSGADNVSYAVKSRVAQGVLSAYAKTSAGSSSAANLDVEAMAAKVRAATVMILVK